MFLFSIVRNSDPPKGQLHEIFTVSRRSLSSTSKLAEHCLFEAWHSSKPSGSKTQPNFQSTCLNLFEPVTMDYGPWTMSCLNAKPGQNLNLLSVIMLLTGTTITWSSATAAGVHRHGHGWAAGGQCSTKTESPSLSSCQVQLERLVGGVFNSLKFEKKWDLLGQHHQGTHLKHEKCHRHCDNDNEFCHLKSGALSKQTPQKPNKQSLC